MFMYSDDQTVHIQGQRGPGGGRAFFDKLSLGGEQKIVKGIQYKENLSYYRKEAEVREVKPDCIKLIQTVIT